MTRQLKPCGTVAAYKRGCRCRRCRQAKSREYYGYASGHVRSRGDGQPGPARRIHPDEVAELLRWGASIDDIANRLGVKVRSIYRQAYRNGTAEERAVIVKAMEGRRSGWSRAA